MSISRTDLHPPTLRATARQADFNQKNHAIQNRVIKSYKKGAKWVLGALKVVA